MRTSLTWEVEEEHFFGQLAGHQWRYKLGLGLKLGLGQQLEQSLVPERTLEVVSAVDTDSDPVEFAGTEVDVAAGTVVG